MICLNTEKFKEEEEEEEEVKKNKWKKAEKNLDSMAVSYHENMKLKEIRFYGQGTFN